VTGWRELDQPERAVFLSSIEEMSQEAVDAKEQEMQNLIDNDVFETVEDVGQTRVSCRWVLTIKEKEG